MAAQSRDGRTPASAEELLRSGVPRERIRSQVVHANFRTLLERNFFCVIFSCWCGLVISLLATLMLTVWLLVSLVTTRTSCDVPLRLWGTALIAYHGVYVVCFATGRRGGASLGQRLCCCWNPGSLDEVGGVFGEHVPHRAKCFAFLPYVFAWFWSAVGLVLAYHSGRRATAAEPCWSTNPSLYWSAVANAIWGAILAVLHLIVQVGVDPALMILLRNGLIPRQQRAAPEGSLEANTTVVGMDDEAVKEFESCLVCLEDFTAEDGTEPGDFGPIVKTQGCAHVFHRACLQNWLNVGRTCPLCRKDLALQPT